MNRTKNATRNIFWGFINKLFMLGIPFLFRTILIKVLGAEYLGLHGLFNSILHILNMTELGFSSAVIYSLYRPVSEGDTDSICALMQEYKQIYRKIGLVICILGLLLMPFLNVFIEGDVPDDINIYILYLIYLSNTILSYWLFAYKTALLEAHQRNDISTKIQSIGFLAQYLLQFILLIYTENYYYYIFCVPLFTLVRNLIISMMVDRMYPSYQAGGQISEELKNSIKKRVQGLLIQKICSATRNSFDSIVISALLGLTTVAKYGNYFYVLTALHGLLDVILVAIRPVIGNSIVESSKEKNYSDFLLFQYIFSWLGGVGTVCLLCLYQNFISLWVGKEMVFSNTIMILFCVYFYSLTMIDIRTVYDDAAGLWWYGKKIVVAESVLNIIFNFILGKFFGVAGIIIATILTVLIVNFGFKTRIIYREYFQEYKIREYFRNHVKYVIITIFTSIIIYPLCQMIPINGFGGLIMGLCVSVIGANLLFLILYRFDQKWRDAQLKMVTIIKLIGPFGRWIKAINKKL